MDRSVVTLNSTLYSRESRGRMLLFSAGALGEVELLEEEEEEELLLQSAKGVLSVLPPLFTTSLLLEAERKLKIKEKPKSIPRTL